MSEPQSASVHSRLAHAGNEEELSAWADRFQAAARGHHGHCGATRLDQTEGMLHLVNLFRDADALAAWQSSPERERLVKEADRLGTGRDQDATDAAPRVALPSEAVAPKWKTWIATWVAVFPVLLALNGLAQLVVPDVPQPLKLVATSFVLTAMLTWVILPRVRRLLRPWLLGDEGGELLRPE